MYLRAEPIFIRVRTPLHVGSGSELGVIDLPIQRERPTNYPKIEASSLKGALRSAFDWMFELNKNKFNEVLKEFVITESIKPNSIIDFLFGPETSNEGSNYKSAISFTDGKILLFPVKSAKGVFTWITSEAVLERFKNDLTYADRGSEIKELNFDLGVSSDKLLIGSGENKKLVLEEFAFNLQQSESVKKVAEKLVNLTGMNELSERFAIVEDDVFKDFVSYSTEVVARTKINDDTGTVQNGALWYEEFAPENTVFYSLSLFSKIFVKDFLNGKSAIEQAEIVQKLFDHFISINGKFFMQIGGDATIGKGICEIMKIKEAKNEG